MFNPNELKRRIDARLARYGSLGTAFIKGAIGTTGIKLAFSGLGFITAIVLAKSLGASDYGTYTFVMALVGFFAIPSELGIPNLAVREIAVANVRKDWGHMRGFIIWAHRVTGLLSIVLMAGAAAALLIWGNRIEADRLRAMWLALLLIPLVSLGSLRGAMLRGLRKVVLGQLPTMVLRPAVMLAFLVSLPLFGFHLNSPDDAMVAQVVSVTIAFLIGVYLFLRHRPAQLSAATPEIKGRLWLQSCIPFGMIATLQMINGKTDMLALGMFREHAEVGVYRVATQFAAIVIFGQQVINVIQGPHVAHLYAKGEIERLRTMITKTSQISCAYAVAIVILVALFGQFAIRVFFGAEFEAAYVPLLILCIGQCVNASMGPVTSLLNMTGHERDTTRSIFIGAVVNIVFNLILTPLWGIIGAAIATAVTLIVWNFLMRQQAIARTGIDSSPITRRRR